MAGVLLAALAVLVTGATLAGGTAIARQRAAWRSELRIVAILREPAGRAAGTGPLLETVRGLAGVAAVRHVPADEALAELQRRLGARGEGLDRLPANPVPGRLEVIPAADVPAAGLAVLVATLAGLAPVEEVDAAVAWVEPLERLERGVRRGGLVLGSLLGVTALLGLSAAMRAAGRAAADETALLRLAGVPEHRLWGPLLLHALALGTLGAGLGVGALLLVSEPGAPWVGSWLLAAFGVSPLPSLPPAWTWALGAGGTTLGLTAGLAAGRP